MNHSRVLSPRRFGWLSLLFVLLLLTFAVASAQTVPSEEGTPPVQEQAPTDPVEPAEPMDTPPPADAERVRTAMLTADRRTIRGTATP